MSKAHTDRGGMAAALRRLRALCLALPETSETAAFGHPNFKAGKKTFAAFETIKGRPSLAFNVGSADAYALLQRGSSYFLTPYGRDAWISVRADEPIDWLLIETLVTQSYRRVALKRMLAALESPRR